METRRAQGLVALSQNEGFDMSAGGGQSSSNSTSMSDALSLAQGFSAGTSNSFGQTGGQSGTFIDPAQQRQQNILNQQSMGLFGQGQGAVNKQQNANAGALQQALGVAQGLADPSAQIAAQSSALQTGLGNLFNNEINPAIEGNSLASGGFGGGRQGVAQGVAAGGLADAFTQGLGDITARANSQALAANNSILGLTQGQMSNAGAGAQFGLSQLGGIGSILGSPTVLSQSTNFGNQGSQSRNFSENQAISESRSRAAGSSEAYDFSFGWEV